MERVGDFAGIVEDPGDRGGSEEEGGRSVAVWRGRAARWRGYYGRAHREHGYDGLRCCRHHACIGCCW